MPGKNSHMKPLELRKQLLITESELNRAQLIQEWRTMSGNAHALAHQARTIRSIASATASLVGGLLSLRRKISVPAAEKPPWWQTILKGAGLVSTLWQSFRTPGREPADKQ
jgi:hypothetical protein